MGGFSEVLGEDGKLGVRRVRSIEEEKEEGRWSAKARWRRWQLVGERWSGWMLGGREAIVEEAVAM